VPGVFAGGDAVLGPASIIDAIAQGRTAATGIDRPGSAATAPDFTPEVPRGTPRDLWKTLPLAQRLDGVAVVEQAHDWLTAAYDAMRCLSCDCPRSPREPNDA
jgi:hypothetical protein